jgi:hypothetical protein
MTPAGTIRWAATAAVIPLTAAEARRLFNPSTRLARDQEHHEHWSEWRRAHQARARRCRRYNRRLNDHQMLL